MEAPGGEPSHPHTGWVADYLPAEPGDQPGEGSHQAVEQEQYKLQEVLDTEVLLIGRVTYESFAGAWPHYEGPFADKMNAMPKVVVSSTLTGPEWTNTTVLSGDVIEGVRALKAQDGGPVLVGGSATLIHALLDHDLVDELRLMVFPVSIGAGLRVFPDTVRKTRWTVSDSTTFSTGVRVDTYRPA